MQALTFTNNLPRCALAKLLGTLHTPWYLSPLGPLRLAEVDPPQLTDPDWVLVRTHHAGICGSDLRQVFLDGSLDNPITSLISFPHVMGHELSGTIDRIGLNVQEWSPGDRVVIHPWLTCAARSLPLCPACDQGVEPCCQNTVDAGLGVGMHLGVSAKVSGGFAPMVAVHRSMCFRVPDNVALDQAALADPLAVALRAVQLAQVQKGQRVLILGCGALGSSAIRILRTYYPGVQILAVDTLEHLRTPMQQLGVEHYYTQRGGDLIQAIARDTGAVVRKPRTAPPWLLGMGEGIGVDSIIDTVGYASTLETGLRIVKPQGRVVHVALARRISAECTPLYFKEVTFVGANGCGMETIDGRRVHAFAYLMEELAAGRLCADGLITHHFPLSDYRQAFLTARHKHRHRSLKVMFDFPCAQQAQP